MENPRFHPAGSGRRRRFGGSPAGDASVSSQDKKKEIYDRRSADAAGADCFSFLSLENRTAGSDLREEGDKIWK